MPCFRALLDFSMRLAFSNTPCFLLRHTGASRRLTPKVSTPMSSMICLPSSFTTAVVESLAFPLAVHAIVLAVTTAVCSGAAW